MGVVGSEARRGVEPPAYGDERQLDGLGRSGSGGGPGSWGPGGWGPGGFGGPGGHGGRGQREPQSDDRRPIDLCSPLERLRLAACGGRRDVLAAILLLLDEWPMRGSQLTSEIAERSGNAWDVRSVSVATALCALEDVDMVAMADVKGHEVAALTHRGADYVEQNRQDLGAPWDDVESSVAAASRSARTVAEHRGCRDATRGENPRERDHSGG